jgi:hypothetical protein
MLVLGPETWPAWLGEEPADARQLKAMLAPHPVRPVSRSSAKAGPGANRKGIPGHLAVRSRAPVLFRRTEAKFPKEGRQPTTRLDRQAPPNEGDGKTTAQCSERRRPEILDRRVPTG